VANCPKRRPLAPFVGENDGEARRHPQFSVKHVEGFADLSSEPIRSYQQGDLGGFLCFETQPQTGRHRGRCDWLTIDLNGNKEMFDVRVAYPNMQNKDDWNAEEMVKKKRPWHI
jgi:hypothetical protein